MPPARWERKDKANLSDYSPTKTKWGSELGASCASVSTLRSGRLGKTFDKKE